MADWFKLHENWFHEPRLQWAIKEQPAVIPCWLWVLTECCRTKSDKVGLHSEDYEMLGIQQLLNMSPGIFNQALKLLSKIRYIEIDEEAKTLKVLKWNEFQSDYLNKKSHRESDKVRQSPTKSDSVVLEERRVEEKREESFSVPDLAPKEKRRCPPTLEMVKDEFKSRGRPESSAIAFFNHYSANDWKRGKYQTPIVNWTALIDGWKDDLKPGQRPPTKLRPSPFANES